MNLHVPSHVPQELVVDIDIYNMPTDAGDPQQTWRRFKEKGPLVYSPYNGGHWVATSGPDIFRFYRDTEHFSSRQVAIPDPGDDRMLPIQADPPLHSQYRANIQGLFTASAVEALAGDIRQLTIDLIETFRARGECEFMSEFALQLPITIFLRMVGLPVEDRLYLRERIETFAADPDLEAKRVAHRELGEYIDKAIEDRIDNPRDDAITHITRCTIDGRPYTPEEMQSTVLLLLHAGLDTVTNMLNFIAAHLAQTPEHQDYIRNHPERMHDIVQELLRRFAVPNLSRVAARDLVWKDVQIRKGDLIMLPPSLFNMDDNIDNPDVVDFSRQARHITFGSGPHTCAGALLARKEIAIFLDEWLTRIPRFRLAPGKPLRMSAAPTNAIHELWLQWDTPA